MGIFKVFISYVKSRVVPSLPAYLQEPQEFYNVEAVLRAMEAGLFSNIWIFSPTILGKKDGEYIYLSPSVTYTYEETFKKWVDWHNEMISEGYFAEGSPPDIWYRFKEPFWNTVSNRWEVKMLACDSEGTCFQTGYVPEVGGVECN